MPEVSLGTYKFDRETKNTRRYQKEDENGRTETVYLKKSDLDGKTPSEVEFIVKF